MGWNTCYGDGGDGYGPSWDDFTDEERAEMILKEEVGRLQAEVERLRRELPRCDKCGGTGELDDAEPGDISYRRWRCETCNGTGKGALTLERDRLSASNAALREALMNLDDAIGALATPDNELSCISEGPERENLTSVWLESRKALAAHESGSSGVSGPAGNEVAADSARQPADETHHTAPTLARQGEAGVTTGLPAHEPATPSPTVLTEASPEASGGRELLPMHKPLVVGHQHTDECWEPDSGCDMGRNPKFARAAPRSEVLPDAYEPPPGACPSPMTDAQIKHMVDRFLGWRLPENFSPDAGINFNAEYNVEYNAKRGLPPSRHTPTGTNLFDASQAEAMVRYMLEGLPERGEQEKRG